MVNLFLTGKAVSNTFDNVMELDTGGAEKVQLQNTFNQTISNQALATLVEGEYFDTARNLAIIRKLKLGACSLVPFQTRPMFPCSLRFSLFLPCITFSCILTCRMSLRGLRSKVRLDFCRCLNTTNHARWVSNGLRLSCDLSRILVNGKPVVFWLLKSLRKTLETLFKDTDFGLNSCLSLTPVFYMKFRSTLAKQHCKWKRECSTNCFNNLDWTCGFIVWAVLALCL